jgi:dipeptidyl-peptidase-4
MIDSSDIPEENGDRSRAWRGPVALEGALAVRKIMLLIVLLCLCSWTFALAADEKQDTKKNVDDQAAAEQADEAAEEEEEELTLEYLFPEKSYWGTTARSTAFSADGRYAAYLFRPYAERRHGDDLWIYDFETGEATRITKVSVMSKFQEATRKVREDRVKKAKKAGLDKKKTKKDDDAENGAEDQADAPPADDGVSGDWEGVITADEGSGLPPDGVPFTLRLEIGEDNAVSGTLRAVLNTATITDGTYDPDTGALTCTLTDPDSGITAAMSATVAEQKMTGTIAAKIDDKDVTLNLTAERTAPLKEAVKKSKAAEEDVEDENGEKEQTEGEEVKQEGDADKEKGDAEEEKEEEEEEIDLGDLVTDKDADDDKAPRYGGVSSFTWAPEANEMIFISGGDLYRLCVETNTIDRLTRTDESERYVQYLPDGSGYMVMRNDALMRIAFGSSLVEQINPRLSGGESMAGFNISPDGKALAFTTYKGGGVYDRSRTVSIINYRSRFAQVRQVSRHVADDPFNTVEWAAYVYQLGGHLTEEGKLSKIYTTTHDRPRDFTSTPAWAEDSSRLAFAHFKQDSGKVKILEATMPEYPKPEADEACACTDEQKKECACGEANKDADPEDDVEKTEDVEKDEDAETPEAEAKPEADARIELKPVEKAAVVYEFFHNGGPTTPPMIAPAYLPDNQRMIFVTELSGFRQLHVLDPLYQQLDQLTRGRFEIYPFDISKDHKWLFAQSSKRHPSHRDIYRICTETGEMTLLVDVAGNYSTVAVNNAGNRIMANVRDFGAPPDFYAFTFGDDAEPVQLTDEHPEKAKKLTRFVPEYFTFNNRHGHEIHGHMFKPDDWTAEDKRPLLIYVYGGPLGRGNMTTRGDFNTSSYLFAYYMTTVHGYVTCTIDPRGVSGYGGLFEKSNFEQAGKPQTEDLVDAAKWFAENQGVDAKRIGLHGWSFGGFQTQMCMYTEPDVFAAGMAGAGPTEWENYNSWYATGTIGPSRTGKADLSKFSLLPLAKNLKGKLLLMHGMEDANVLYQDTVRVYRELLKAGKETLVELFLDPTGGHGMGGDVKNINRFRKYEEFLVRVLGEGEAVVVEEEEAPDAESAEPAEAETEQADVEDETEETEQVEETEESEAAIPAHWLEFEPALI